MANLFDSNARSDEALVGGQKADVAMGAIPRAGLSFPRPQRADPMADPAAYQRNIEAAYTPRPAAPGPTQAAPNADPIIGYDPASNSYVSNGQRFSSTNLSEIDAAMQSGYLDIDNTGKLPPGAVKIRASKIKAYLQAEGAKRGFGSAAAEVGNQVLRGIGDIPQMGVRAAQYFAPAGSGLESSLKEAGDAYDTSNAQNNPDVYGRGEVASALIKGGRSIAPSIAAGAAMFAAPVAGAAAAGTAFFGSTASDTYERGLAAGLSQEDARAAANKTGAYEALGELAGDFAGAKVLVGAGKGLSMMAKGVQMSHGKRVAVDLLANAGIQTGTEFGQAYGQASVERDAGISGADPMAAGIEGAKVGLGMSALMAPFGAGAGYMNRPRGALPQAPAPEAPATPEQLALGYTPAEPADPLLLQRSGVPINMGGPEAPAQLGYTAPEPRQLQRGGVPIETGWNPETATASAAGQAWQGMAPAVAAGQAGAAWQGMPQAQNALEGGYASVEEQRAAAAEVQAQRDAAAAQREALVQQRIDAVNPRAEQAPAPDVQSPVSPSEGSPVAVAPSVTPQEPQTPVEPFDRQKLARQTRSDIARAAQDMGIQITGKPTKAQILGMIDQKVAGVEPTPAVAPAKPAPTKGAKAAKPAAAAPAQPLTPEEEELSQAIEDERASSAGMAATNASMLKSAVQSLPGGRPRGKITLGRNIMAGIVRALRKPFNPDAGDTPALPVVYVEGTAKTEKDLTKKYSTQMTAMRDAALKVAKLSDVLANLGGNTLRSESDIPETSGSRAKSAEDKAKKERLARQQLKNAIEQLIEVSGPEGKNGTAANANALVAAFKTRVQTEKVKKTLSGTKKQVTGAKTGKGKEKDVGQYWTSLDTNLSRAWKMYNDGHLVDTENLASPSGGEKRNSWEMQKEGAEAEPLVKAAEKGAGSHNGGAAEKGILGVLNYLASHSNTGYERMLAKAIAYALRGQKKVPKVAFDVEKGEHASYTPADDTIHLQRTASAEVSLHEALHAALQWVVYTRPKHAAVLRLTQAVKDVVAYDRNKLTSVNAKGAYDIIAGLAKSGTKGDMNAAILELISYGSTMPDFIAALRAIPSKQDQQFKSLGQKLYDMVARLMQAFLGVKNTVANDVLDATARLLEEAGTGDRAAAFGTEKVKKGKKLNAAEFDPGTAGALFARVQSSTPASNATQPGAPESIDLTRFAKKMLPNLITEHVFKSMGWGAVPDKVLAGAGTFADYIKDKSPALSKYIGYVNANFNVPVPMREWLQTFKNDKHISAIVTDKLANYISALPSEDVLEIIKYLDGDVKEIVSKGKPSAELKGVADMVLDHRKDYIDALRTPKAQAFFRDLKFSESMVFAKSTDDVASSALGSRKLNEMAAQKTDTQISENVHTGLDHLGDLVTTGRFKQLMHANTTQPGGKPLPAGFIHESMYNDPAKLPAGTVVATDGLIWTFEGKGAEKDSYKFTAYRDAKQAIAAGHADAVANAMRNTMAILAASYASNNLTDSLAGASGDKHKVVFDSLDAIAAATGSRPTENSVLQLSSREAKSSKLQGVYRSRYQWVQIPSGGVIKNQFGEDVSVGTYGALAGKLVRSDVWAAVQDMTDRRPLHDISAVHTTMRVFKKAKTVYNPGTHLTNIASNLTLAMMHDIPMPTVGKAVSLLFQYQKNPDAMNAEERRLVHAFMNSGASLGDFSSIEVKKSLYDAYKDAAGTNEPAGITAKVLGWARIEKAKSAQMAAWAKAGQNAAGKTDERITALYAAEDNAFRLAAFLTKAGEIATSKGKTYLTPAEFKVAGDYARFAFLDYDIDSKAVKVLRQSVLPFVSWSYAIAPVLGHIALHKPWKLVNVLLAYALIDAATGGDDDDEKRAGGPERFQSRLWGVGPHAYIRLPGLGDEQNPVYFKLGAYIPTGNWADRQPQGFLGINNWPLPISPGGPFTNAVLGLMGGVDPYTGKPLSAPTDSDWEGLGDRAAFMAKTFTPSWAPVATDLGTKALGGQGKPELGVSGNPVGNLAAARAFSGLQVDSFNTVEAGAIQAIATKAIKAEFDKELAKIKRAQSRYENPDWEAFNKRRDELLQRRDERIKDLKGD